MFFGVDEVDHIRRDFSAFLHLKEVIDDGFWLIQQNIVLVVYVNPAYCAASSVA